MKPVDINTGLKLVIEKLESAGIEYMIVGSIAGALYGEPRLTRDIDLVIAMSSASVKSLLKVFDPLDFYVPPADILSQEITRCGQTNILHHASGVKADLMFRKNTPHGLEEFARKRRLEILRGVNAWIAAPEDIIIGKLRYYREGGSEKHLTDIRGILANSDIDREYLHRWTSKLGLEEYFQKI
jgi:hypothetical protein